ncbi:hypothetical protein OROHE_026935 [Orobanche hederae]
MAMLTRLSLLVDCRIYIAPFNLICVLLIFFLLGTAIGDTSFFEVKIVEALQNCKTLEESKILSFGEGRGSYNVFNKKPSIQNEN